TERLSMYQHTSLCVPRISLLCFLYAYLHVHHFFTPLFFVQRDGDLRELHSFPTRRSSDLNEACADYIAGLTARLCKFNGSHKLRSEEHTSELQSRFDLVCRLLLEKKKYEIIANNVKNIVCLD